MNRTGEHSHVMLFHEWRTPNSSMWVIEATPNVCRHTYYDTTTLLNGGYVPRRYLFAIDPENHSPVIEGHLHCMYPQQDCDECLKPGREITLAITASDEDDDPLTYHWSCLVGCGYFLPGEVDYIVTQDSFVTYVTPGYPMSFKLWVYVYDNQGGGTSLESEFDVYPPDTSCLCGDANNDGAVGAGDVTFLLSYLFRGGPPPEDPIERADANNDCSIGAEDITYLLAYLFRNGPPPECCWFRPVD
jgi:hypothetical protein